ncbi:MAG: peptidase C39 family protein [Methanoregula sp.]|nr:peptidase C39 family protein [Methanoregula sp.]
MQADLKAAIHLSIPFYRQHYDFTCGPACLMMAMKYLEPGVRPGKDLEIDLWREANLVAVCGTSRYGLAFSATTRGFSARVTSSTGGIDFAEKFVPSLDDPAMLLLREQFSERRARCKKLHVRERKTTITGKTLREALFSNHVPLIVTSSWFCDGEDCPHWVVVTGIDEKFLSFYNPSDVRQKKRRIGLPDLSEFVGYHGDQSMVEVWKQ